VGGDPNITTHRSTPMDCLEPVTLSLDAMATRFELVLHGDDPRGYGPRAKRLCERSNCWTDSSAVSPESDISWINAHASREPVKVEPQLFRLLQRSGELSSATNGAFDITIAPLMRAWGLAGGEGNIPSESDLDAARARVGAQHVRLNEANFTVSFEL